MAMSGVCDEDCTKELVIFLMLFLLIMLCSFVGSTAGQAATLRSVFALATKVSLTLTAREPTLYVRIWRLQTSDSDV